jgi:hypothetical protein
MKKTRILFYALGAVVLFAIGWWIGMPSKSLKLGAGLYTPTYNDTYFASLNSATSGTMIQSGPGVFHTLVFTAPVASSVISIYDGATAIVLGTGQITVGATSTATSTGTGMYTVLINGLSVVSASENTSTAASTTAAAIALAINSSSSLVGVTAATSSNVIYLTANTVGSAGNFTLSATNPQYGMAMAASTTLPSVPTVLMAKFTFPTSTMPLTATFDDVFGYGLVVDQTVATSTMTFNTQ